jgi:Sec-independent protein secretion pathway component TatC
MLLPGTDPVTMLISMLPLYLLFEFSILLARWFGTPHSEPEEEPGLGGPEARAGGLN